MAAAPPDFLLATKTNCQLAHIRAIDAGGGGEVHEVKLIRCTSRNTDILLAFRSRLWQSKPFSYQRICDTNYWQVFARKIIRLAGRITETDINNEIRAVAKLCMTAHTHKNIVSVFDYGQLSAFIYYIDMELCDLNLEQWIYRTWHQDLAKELHHLTAELPPRMRIGQVWDIMEDITRAVAFIHDEHEIHRDLKPSNSLYAVRDVV
jgi:serine/threonine protein kinase